LLFDSPSSGMVLVVVVMAEALASIHTRIRRSGRQHRRISLVGLRPMTLAWRDSLLWVEKDRLRMRDTIR
jgi:hypothetical protein